MNIIANWDSLSHSERDALIEKEIMHRPGAYTTSLEAAFELIDEIVSHGCVVSVAQWPDKPTEKHCSIWSFDRPVEIAKGICNTIPDAIGKAAITYKYQYKK